MSGRRRTFSKLSGNDEFLTRMSVKHKVKFFTESSRRRGQFCPRPGNSLCCRTRVQPLVVIGSRTSPHRAGGGICGHGCSGCVRITQCWSTGEIRGDRAGGIAGMDFGLDGGADSAVTISHCYSTGEIVGQFSGGICGCCAGESSQGKVTVKQCYSLGEIGGSQSGGITGVHTARDGGHVFIINCYSRGNITGSGNAGGICGRNTGWKGDTVILTNVYASGTIVDQNNAGGLIGGIDNNANEINITMSVYNGDTGGMIGAGSNNAHNKENNSGDLGNITGTVYCYNDDYGDGKHKEYCWDTQTIWQAVKDHFPILIERAAAITPTVNPISHPTSSISLTLQKKQRHRLRHRPALEPRQRQTHHLRRRHQLRRLHELPVKQEA